MWKIAKGSQILLRNLIKHNLVLENKSISFRELRFKTDWIRTSGYEWKQSIM